MRRRHENVKREFRRLRKTEPRLGQLLTGDRMRCGGEMASAPILATKRGESCAAASARIEIGGCGAAGRVYKGEETGGEGTARTKSHAVVVARLVSCSDSRSKTTLTAGPHLLVKRSAGPPCQLLRRGDGRGLQAWAGSWRWAALRERKEGGGTRPGKRKNGPSPRVGRVQQHGCTNMCLYLIVNFNSIKIHSY